MVLIFPNRVVVTEKKSLSNHSPRDRAVSWLAVSRRLSLVGETVQLKLLSGVFDRAVSWQTACRRLVPSWLGITFNYARYFI